MNLILLPLQLSVFAFFIWAVIYLVGNAGIERAFRELNVVNYDQVVYSGLRL